MPQQHNLLSKYLGQVKQQHKKNNWHWIRTKCFSIQTYSWDIITHSFCLTTNWVNQNFASLFIWYHKINPYLHTFLSGHIFFTVVTVSYHKYAMSDKMYIIVCLLVQWSCNKSEKSMHTQIQCNIIFFNYSYFMSIILS